MTGRVSVLIPCYNAERYVGETLSSVRAQTWPDVEIVVVDDGSTDSSVDVVLAAGGPDLKLVRQENRGQTAALNTALANATGDFIQYLDADDLIDPKKIELQMARLADAPDCVASAEWGRFYNDPAETPFSPERVWRDLDPLDWLTQSRADGLGMMFPALWLTPVAIARAAGPWDEALTLNNDAEYFTRVLLASRRVLFTKGARCRYRSGLPSSLSGQKSARHWASQRRVLELCEGYVRAREDSDRVREGFSLSWQHLAHACLPYDRALADLALERAAGLHPTRIDPGGGMLFKLLSRTIGWRAARRLQVMTGRN